MKKVDKSLVISIIVILIIYIGSFIFTGHGLPCLIKKVTHLYCPGCGISRMFISIFSLDFYQAFRYNPLIFTLLILYLLFLLTNLILKILKYPLVRLNKGVYILLIIVTIAFGIMRNMSYFSYLAPTIVK